MIEVFADIDKTISVDDKKINEIFTICDINCDKKISKKEFQKVVDLFLEPIYTNQNEGKK